MADTSTEIQNAYNAKTQALIEEVTKALLSVDAAGDNVRSLQRATRDLQKAIMALENVSQGESLGLAAAANSLDQIPVGDRASLFTQLGLGSYALQGQFRDIEIIAHRGFRDHSIQNTMLAFTTCLGAGADSIELDVQVTSDGVAVCYHDDDLSSLTNRSGVVTATSSSTVLAAELKQAVGTPYEGQVKVPKFSELLEYVKEKRCRFYPEIKGAKGADDVKMIVNMVQDAGLSELCCWQAFQHDDLDTVRQLDAVCEIGYLTSSGDITYLQQLAARAAALRPSSLLIERSDIYKNQSIVEYARIRGVDIGTWTIDTRDQLDSLKKVGVRRLMCDQAVGDNR